MGDDKEEEKEEEEGLEIEMDEDLKQLLASLDL